jgi:eukaryotic-like serine/threonine-protein kinase
MNEHFGRYILEERIAIGGMAEIFRAKAPGLGGFEKVLAIKRLHPRFSQDADFIEMLIDEARITVELSHDNIGQIFDLGKVHEHYYIAMEFIDGRDLYRVMKRLKDRRRFFPFDVAAYVAMEACAGLDYAHRKRDSRGRPLHIIHRDVSPQNVLLSFEGAVKLVDFGIAKAALRAYETEAGIIKGKFYYMSPEQAKGEPLDHRTDVFSLGIVLYEMLTGDLLYKDEDDVTLLSRVRRADIEPPRLLRPDIPPALERIVLKALARDRSDRYPSAQHMQRDLAAWLRDAGSVEAKGRLGALMRDVYGEYTGAEAPLPVGGLVHQRNEFDDIFSGGDDHSVISVASPEETFFDDEETRVEPSILDGGLIEIPHAVGEPSMGLPQQFESGMMELDADDIELIDDDPETINFDGPAPLPDAFDSIETSGYDDGFGLDEDTHAFEDYSAQPAQAQPVQARPARARPVAARPVQARPAQAQPVAARRVVLPRASSEEQVVRTPTVIVPREGPKGTKEMPGVAGAGRSAAKTGRLPAPRGPVHRPAQPRAGRDVGRRAVTPPSGSQTTETRAPAGFFTRERLVMAAFLVGVIVVAGVATSLFIDEPSRAPVAGAPVGPVAVPVTAPMVRPVPSAMPITTAQPTVRAQAAPGTVAPVVQVAVATTAPVMVPLRGAPPTMVATAAVAQVGQVAQITQVAQVGAIAASATLEVRSLPSNASVRIDGKWQTSGRTPATFSVPAGRAVDLRVQLDNYEPFNTQVVLQANQAQRVQANLVRISGTITVESKPSGALVTVDGRDVGRTPLTLDNLPMLVAARVRITKDGFEPHTATVEWGSRREHLVEASLEPVNSAPPVVAQAKPKPKPKRRRRKRPRTRRPRRADPPLAQRPQPTGSGYISVNARQWGSVIVDGALVARETPLFKYQLSAGSHRVQVCFRGDRANCSPSRSVSVSAGRTAVVKF